MGTNVAGFSPGMKRGVTGLPPERKRYMETKTHCTVTLLLLCLWRQNNPTTTFLNPIPVTL